MSAAGPDSLSWKRFGDRLAAGAVPLLPFGAYEQHGPHLPLSTDTVMAQGLTRRLATVLHGEVDTLVLPPVEYGQTTDNDGFPGTLTLSFDTVRAIALDLAAALHRQGARCLVVVNGDFGNQAPLRVAARESVQRWDFPVLVINYPGMAEAADAALTSEPAGYGLRHADEFETSIMLALTPDDVRMDTAVAEYPEYPAVFPALQIGLHELSVTGVFGDPTAATAEKGEALLERLSAAAAELVRAFVSRVDGDRASGG
ncbi:creatininase family protein [Nakamurella flavida]|uniref:Creatininase family protein n=1 Tax=Nakamurella flavida TaxID=363630 RepID=A0A938YT38_9ACTN|nr:creatininase family protein [Nakamurella flavida]MBM9475965.1 creatininase family protein [Nakamurella flavida]MBM9478375.1 creatininase family protein [Nakamurella flavida]MDP9777746.1 creatinine amidohydrolase [Nakamurella flavida]